MSVPLAAFLERFGVDPASLVPLAGDASTRHYHRASAAGGGSVVVMENGEPAPFARWCAFYESLGIRVPRVLGSDELLGAMVLEDLGDEMLQQRLEREGADSCREHYLQALRWARILRERGTELHLPESATADDPLVPRRLAWEMDFLLRHALGRPEEEWPAEPEDGPAELGASRALLHRLCLDVHAASLAGLALCHRDYHARNLAVTPSGELAVLDLQDTRRGPRAYDTASLLWDPYVGLPARLLEELQEHARPDGATSEDWDRELRLAAGQRLLKAAGSYAMLGRTKGRSEYLRWWAPALSRAFERLGGAWEPAGELERRMRGLGLDW